MSMKEICASHEEKLPYSMHCFMTQVTLLSQQHTDWLPSCKPSVLPTDKPRGDKNENILANSVHGHSAPLCAMCPSVTCCQDRHAELLSELL